MSVKITGRKAGTNVKINKEFALDTNDDSDDVFCGVGSFRPTFLQPCATVTSFVGCISISTFLTSCLSVYITSQITTLERMFAFSSSTSGFILSCNDIGYLMSVLFATYFARRTHIPKVLCFATTLYGIAGLVCCIPYFLTRDNFILGSDASLSFSENQSQSVLETTSDLCLPNRTDFNISAPCEKNAVDGQSASLFGLTNDQSTLAIVLISVGMILQGFAKSPRFPFINIYVDDNVTKTKSALYIGFLYGIGILGPAAAFALGGVFSKIYVTLQETNMSYRDTRWVGAWWLGFLIFGAAAVLFAWPIYLFPKHMIPKSKRLSAKESGANKPVTLKDLKGLLQALWRLARNPVYCPLVIAEVVHHLVTGGALGFIAKYVETQFHVPVWKADMLIGASLILAAGFGSFTGGAIISKFKLSVKACIKMLVSLHTIYFLSHIALVMIGCPRQEVEGDWKVVGANHGTVLKNVSCQNDCLCDTSLFLPVCDEEMGVTYFSSCHAGCSGRNRSMYTNCSCVLSGNVQPGYCHSECPMLIPFAILLFVSTFLVSMTILNFVMLIMRSVSEEDKPLALGLSSFMGNLVGWMPEPILFGLIIDTSCLVWNSNCSEVGSCAIYDNEDFRYKFYGVSMGIRGVAVLIQFFVLWKVLTSSSLNDKTTSKPPELDKLNGTNEMLETTCNNDNDGGDCKSDMLPKVKR